MHKYPMPASSRQLMAQSRRSVPEEFGSPCFWWEAWIHFIQRHEAVQGTPHHLADQPAATSAPHRLTKLLERREAAGECGLVEAPAPLDH